MKFRALTQTVGSSKDGITFSCSTLILPVGGSLEVLGTDIVTRTFTVQTRITTENYIEFRHYRWWALMNYRVILKHDGVCRAIDFRGRSVFRDPSFFRDMGYVVTTIDKFCRRSADSEDEEKYGLVFPGGC